MSTQSQSGYWRGDFGVDAPGGSPDDPDGLEHDASLEHVRLMYARQAVKQKDHISAGLLAIFLGMFGVHKFYLGYNQSAFVMLAVTVIGGIVTLGLASAVVGVIAAIEGIIYLTRSQTDFDRIYVMNQRDWF